MSAKVLSVDAAAELVGEVKTLRSQRHALVTALKETADIVEEEIAMMVDSGCAKDRDGHAILSTLNDGFKPDFERYKKALQAARKAIEKAGGQ